jgi:murein DD-endopeptidase
VFAQRTRGLFDFLAAALCLWAAAYHTPPGALLRGAIARLTDTRSSSRPLLAYYSGGVYEAQTIDTPTQPIGLPGAEQLSGIAAGPAIGRGVYAALRHLPADQKQTALALARRYAIDPAPLDDPGRGPSVAAALIAKAQGDLGTEDAAVLAVFCGFETAEFAVRRAQAEHRSLELEFLALQLPPSQHAAINAASEALTLGTAYALAWPVPPRTHVSSPFGWRSHPTLGRQQLHTGVDLSVAEGTVVQVTAAGIVRRASEDGVNGKVVIIDHGRGVSTAYCHNSKLRVVEGQRVQAGDIISESGNTGRSTGPHLHYQLELAHTPMDPFLFKSAHSADLLVIPTPKPQLGPVAPVLRQAPALINALKASAVVPGVLDGGANESDRQDPQNATEL